MYARARARGCMYVWVQVGDVIFFKCECRRDCLWVCGRYFCFDGESAEGRYTSNDCALNRSQKRYYTTFTSVLFYLYTFYLYVELSNCPFYCGIRVTQKANFHFMHLL